MRIGVFAAFSGGKIFSGFPGFSAPTQRGHELPQAGSPLTGSSFSCTGRPGCANCVSVFALSGRRLFCTDPAGHSNCVSVFALTGRLFFLHRKAGVREQRQRVRPFRAAGFSLRFSEGVALCGARESAAPAAGAKRKGHLRFPFLFELLPFPCFLIWRRFPICDRREKGNGSRVTAACLSPPFRSSQTAYCYTCGLINAECGITVPHNSSARYDRQHLRR